MPDLLTRLQAALSDLYRVERELGRGGMATVYLANDLKHDRQVAIKVLRPDLAQSLGPGRFLREIRIASHLTHPNILPVYDSGSADGLLFYVMPYVAGESLAARIHRETQLPLSDAIQIAREIAGALEYAHAEDIVHRDIKPGNILLEAGHAVIADFGLARAIRAAATDDLSSTGLALGTPPYMSPEQSSGDEEVDGRSDIYSLGCVLYEMLAGEPPFTGPSAQAIAAKHLHLPPPPLRTVRPHTPAFVVAAIERALEKIPADRFQSASEFAQALETIEIPSGTKPKRHSPVWAAVLLAIAAVGGAILVGRQVREGQPQVTAGDSVNTAADPTHIAVLYFDAQSADTTMKWVANGLTEDLIDQLGQVNALSVISANGVRPYRDRPASPDSIARALSVGTLVSGTVAGTLDKPRVTVRLIEPSGRQVDSRVIEARGGDVLSLRGELVQQVAEFLRQRVGQEIKLRKLRSGGDARAWVHVRRADELREDARTLYAAGDTSAAQRTLSTADSVLSLAEKLDSDWVEPIVLRGWVAVDRIELAEARTAEAISQWAPRGLAHAERALARKPNYPSALELRGFLRLAQWEYSNTAERALVEAAERDLRRAAVPENPNFARTQSTLAYLLWRRGSFAEANLAAQQSYKADAFMADAPAVLYRLYITSLMLRRWPEAANWCAQGYQRFSDQWLFTLCRLTLLSLPIGKRPEATRAWQLFAEMEQVTPPSEWVILGPRWRTLVATILARAGLADSARSTLAVALQAGQGDPEMYFYEAETRVVLGQNERALSLLKRYLAHVPSQRAFVQGWPTFEPLQHHPQFSTLAAPQ